MSSESETTLLVWRLSNGNKQCCVMVSGRHSAFAAKRSGCNRVVNTAIYIYIYIYKIETYHKYVNFFTIPKSSISMFNFPGQVSPQSRSIVTGRLTTLRRKADVEGGPVKAVGKTCKCRRLNGILSIYLDLLTSRKVFFLPRLGHWFGQTRLCRKLVTSSYRIKLQKTRNESERVPIPTGKAVKTRRMSLSQALIGGKRG